jgi:hypothetical protein
MGAGTLARLSCIDRGLGLKFCSSMVVIRHTRRPIMTRPFCPAGYRASVGLIVLVIAKPSRSLLHIVLRGARADPDEDQAGQGHDLSCSHSGAPVL